MLSKHALGYDPKQVPAAKRLRANIADLTLSNQISGQRAQSLINDAHSAGVGGFRDLSGTVDRNSRRNITRKLLKGSKWPKRYEALIRAKNAKTGDVEKAKTMHKR